MNSSRVPKLLIVEDFEPHWSFFQDLFESPPERYRIEFTSRRTEFSIDRFEVHIATNRLDAERLLAEADRNLRPYDVMLLDLGLPESPGEHEPVLVDEGYKLLPMVTERSCTQVVITTIQAEPDYFEKALRSDVCDYIIKPDPDKWTPQYALSVFRSVASACVKGVRRLESRWNDYLRERTERWRLVQTCAGLVDCASQIVTDGVGRLREHGRDLTELLAARYELRPEHDADDPLCRSIVEIMEDADWIANEFMNVRRHFGNGGFDQDSSGETASVSPQSVDINELVTASAGRCLPGLALKGLAISYSSDEKLEARVFRHDVEMILDELLCNAIEASDPGQSISVKVAQKTGSQRERTIEIRVADHAAVIKTSYREAIAANRPLSVDGGRSWGLSLAQRVAENSGAWIDVDEPGPSVVGNIVTLHIPVAS
jgi:CheY-like chemotaxis protein